MKTQYDISCEFRGKHWVYRDEVAKAIREARQRGGIKRVRKIDGCYVIINYTKVVYSPRTAF